MALHVQSLVHVVLAEDAGLDAVTDQIRQFPDQAEMLVRLVCVVVNPLLHSGVSHSSQDIEHLDHLLFVEGYSQVLSLLSPQLIGFREDSPSTE